MVRPQLTLKFLGKVFGALVFIAAGMGALSGCNGVPTAAPAPAPASRRGRTRTRRPPRKRRARRINTHRPRRPETWAIWLGRRTFWTLLFSRRQTFRSRCRSPRTAPSVCLSWVKSPPPEGAPRGWSATSRRASTRVISNRRRSRCLSGNTTVSDVTVEGAVRSPGVYPLRGNDTLMQVLAKSGG